jgi:hypothetical protein
MQEIMKVCELKTDRQADRTKKWKCVRLKETDKQTEEKKYASERERERERDRQTDRQEDVEEKKVWV